MSLDLKRVPESRIQNADDAKATEIRNKINIYF